jgi:hypothetical protein
MSREQERLEREELERHRRMAWEHLKETAEAWKRTSEYEDFMAALGKR